MATKEILTSLAVIIYFAGCVPYLWGMYRRETKPHMFSWVVWGIVSAVTGAIQLQEGAGKISGLIIFNAIYCAGIAVASIWLGTRDVKRSDVIALAFALLSIPLWVVTSTPIWSALLLIVIDGTAYFPTVRKSWTAPHEESILSWAISVLAFSCTIAAFESYSLAGVVYPATFAVVNLSFVCFLLWRRRGLVVV